MVIYVKKSVYLRYPEGSMPTHTLVFFSCVCVVQASSKFVAFSCFALNEKLEQQCRRHTV